MNVISFCRGWPLSLVAVFSLITAPWRLFNFEALRCGAYCRDVFKRGMSLLQSKINYSHEISKVSIFLFPSNNK